LSESDIKWADVILTMEAAHRDKVVAIELSAQEKTYLLREYAYGDPTDVVDPEDFEEPEYVAFLIDMSALVAIALERA
jgi:protein-tyrosine phosphatase